MLRQNVGLVKALVGAGFSVMKQNTRSWLALDEAVSLKNRELVSARLLRRHASFLLAHPSRPCSFCTSHCTAWDLQCTRKAGSSAALLHRA